VGIGVDGDVGERHGVADEPLAAADVRLERVEHLVAGRGPLLDQLAVLLRASRVRDEEANDGERRLQLVLLEVSNKANTFGYNL
jgi:hypothetical protein